MKYINSLQIYYGFKMLLLPEDQTELVINSSQGYSAQVFFETILFSEKQYPNTWRWVKSQIKAIHGTNKIIITKDELATIDSIENIRQIFKSKFSTYSDIDLENIRIEVTLKATEELRREIQHFLFDYSKQFINDELVGGGIELKFSRHVVLFREYLQTKLNNISAQNIHIQKSEIVKRFIISEYGSPEFNFRFIEMIYILWSVGVIRINKLTSLNILDHDKHLKYSLSELIDYEVEIKLEQMHLFMVDAIRKDYDMPPVSGTEFILPKDQKYTYDDGSITVPLPTGGVEKIAFKKKSKKIFKAFYMLWKNNQKGFYTRKEVLEAYKSENNGETLSNRLLSTRKHAIKKKIGEEPYFIDKIIIDFDKSKPVEEQGWIFKILI